MDGWCKRSIFKRLKNCKFLMMIYKMQLLWQNGLEDKAITISIIYNYICSSWFEGFEKGFFLQKREHYFFSIAFGLSWEHLLCIILLLAFKFMSSTTAVWVWIQRKIWLYYTYWVNPFLKGFFMFFMSWQKGSKLPAPLYTTPPFTFE